ncbi:MAG: hypothetical protein KKD18_04480 [Nanoarchaeota archaeon]|nr:hypothetical protein [Nanoarchaeota archaeon]MBU0977647.1 hypothetical protein [Nanoarchaeota archaeon]
MHRNLFVGHFGAIVALIAVIFFFGGFYFDVLVRNTIWTVFFFGFGIINLWNSKRTGRFRYVVTGTVFLLATVVGFFNTFFFDSIPWSAIWLISVILFVLAVPIASLLRSVGLGRNKEENT